jgi:hypothetical protein
MPCGADVVLPRDLRVRQEALRERVGLVLRQAHVRSERRKDVRDLVDVVEVVPVQVQDGRLHLVDVGLRRTRRRAVALRRRVEVDKPLDSDRRAGRKACEGELCRCRAAEPLRERLAGLVAGIRRGFARVFEQLRRVAGEPDRDRRRSSS